MVATPHRHPTAVQQLHQIVRVDAVHRERNSATPVVPIGRTQDMDAGQAAEAGQ